jgi:hypothetical protein
MKGMLRFKGTITAQGPLAVSYPGAGQEIPTTPSGTPMLYGNTLRGPLRHIGYKVIRDLLAKAQGVSESDIFELADAYMLGIGFDMTNAVGDEDSKNIEPLAEVKLRESNPFLGLFGRWKLRGFAEVSPLIGDEAAQTMTYGAGSRRDPFEADGEEAQFLSEADRQMLVGIKSGDAAIHEQIMALNQAIKEHKRQIVHVDDKDEKKKINSKIRDLESQVKELKGSKAGGKESVKHPFDGFPALAPNSRLSSKITVASGSEVELGLLLLILRAFARSPFLGGHRANGCGEVRFEYQVSLWEADTDAPTILGTVSGGLDEGFVIDGDTLRDALDSFVANIQSFDFKMVTLKEAAGKKGG